MNALTPLTSSSEMQPTPSAETSLAPAQDLAAWLALGHVPLRLAVYVPLENITLRDLLQIRPGHILRSSWPVANDIPVRAGDVLMSWAEFENVDGRMATRLTRLA